VAIAQIRRTALSQHGQPVEPSGDLTGPFSETALYVLVRRGGTWWVAAGQNTPVLTPRPDNRRPSHAARPGMNGARMLEDRSPGPQIESLLQQGFDSASL